MAERHKDPAASVYLGKGKIRIFCHALQQDGHRAVLSRNGADRRAAGAALSLGSAVASLRELWAGWGCEVPRVSSCAQ